ncbi:Ribosome biogenesis protein brx1 [Entomophthora muscae]|uniref:Ribosome biogenesis protein brx1 n=1 Tax=Entomophthora muscae TaxID=34485 RepID=A0ACC2S9N9_9FUNG|nr:Ribosome biogenesis protein brx1 [Entomophthora muscae]
MMLPKNVETDVKYKQRVLLLSSRGILSRQRHLMQDLASLLPHCKKDAKLDTKSNLRLLNELADLNNCNNCIFFESRKGMDLYMWISKTPNGPSAKFHVQNIHTMDELKLTGNCLKGSRPVLSFDQSFDSAPHFQLLKEMFTHAFAVPKSSRRVKPFIDHVTSLSIVDNRVWFRTYQIIEKDPEALPKEKMALVEVGPRFCLNLIRIFGGSFSGSVLYENKEFISPNMIRSSIKVNHANKYAKRKISNAERAYQMVKNQLPIDPLDKAFA